MKRAICTIAALAGIWSAAPRDAAAADKRPLPEYDGRKPEPTTPGDVGIWTLRVIFSPLYFVSEFLLRRPLGALIAGAERAGVPALLYDFFAFGPEHKFGIVPTGYLHFNFNPSIGIYSFWDDAFAKGHDMRLHLGTWGPDWLSGTLTNRIRLGQDKYDRFVFAVSASRRPDYAFYGLGPRTVQSDRMRYGADRLGAEAGIDERLYRASSFHMKVGVRSTDFKRGRYDEDPALDDRIAAGALPPPPGLDRGYTVATSTITAAFDNRRERPASGSGIRIEGEATHAADLRRTGSWVSYGASVGGFLDLNERGRVVSLSATTRFVEPLEPGVIPFTELATLGGTQMRGFFPGRMYDRSAAVLALGYRWPVWMWLDGAMRFEVGNVFGPQLRDFKPGLLRFSGAIGLESVGSPDNSLQILFGVGSETFESGGKIDSFRFIVGTTNGL